ncbi:MAG: hypothetical protein VW268_01125 [Rhodospirillaceae bacterium]
MFGTFPEGRLQVLTHHTPDHMWQERYIACDNHVEGLTDVVICVEDPAASARALAGLTRRQSTDGRATDGRVEFDRGRVDYATPEGLAALIPGAVPLDLPFMAAGGLLSRDIVKTTAFMKARGVKISEGADGPVIVDAADGLGCYLVIRGVS